MLLNKRVWNYLLILIIILFFLYIVKTWVEPYIDKSAAGTFSNLVNQSFKSIGK